MFFPKRLVFSGGGTQSLVFLPTLRALEHKGNLKNVKEWWGTSAGSLMASLCAVSQSAEKTAEIMMRWDYSKFRDVNLMNILQLTDVWGLDNGECLLREIEAMLDAAKPGSSQLLLADISGLHIFVSDLTTHTTVCCSSKTFPTLRLAHAIRASMSFPMMICPFRCPLNGHIWVDGGIRANFAWDEVASDEEREQSLGFCLKPTWINGPTTFFDYVFSLVHFDEPAKSKQWMERWKRNILWFPTPPYPVWYVRLRLDDYKLLETISLPVMESALTTWTSRKPQPQQQSEDLRTPPQVSHQGHTNGTLGSHEYLSLQQPSHPSQDSPQQIPRLSRRWSL